MKSPCNEITKITRQHQQRYFFMVTCIALIILFYLSYALDRRCRRSRSKRITVVFSLLFCVLYIAAFIHMWERTIKNDTKLNFKVKTVRLLAWTYISAVAIITILTIPYITYMSHMYLGKNNKLRNVCILLLGLTFTSLSLQSQTSTLPLHFKRTSSN